jgi:AraC-like DNA-binding protein
MSALATISTRDVSPREKFDFWQEGLWQLCGKLRAETQADGTFGGKLEYAMIGDVTIAKVTASRHRIVRTPIYGGPGHSDFLKVVLQIKGTSCFEQGGRRVVLSPLEWSFYEATLPYCVSAPKGTETLVAIIPRNNIATKRIHIDDLTLRKFSGREGMGKLALQFMISAFDEIPVITPDTEWEIASAISNLIRLAMLDATDVPTEISLGQIWRDRIKSYVVSHLRDPELSIDQIADALNCTKRYVHKVFQSESASVSEWILRKRLARCREDLRNPARARSSITDIAYSWGFNNPAHFSRAFKEEFHLSPSFFRMDAKSGGAVSLRPERKFAATGASVLKLRPGKISPYS